MAFSRVQTTLCASILAALVAVGSPLCARAQTALAQAVEHAAMAEFDEALADFDAALSAGQLDLESLTLLLRERVLVAHAIGDNGRLAQDLSYLALIGNSEELDGRAPPDLVERWEQVRRAREVPLSISCEPRAIPGGIVFRVTVTGAEPWMDIRARISVRTPGSPWQAIMASESRYPVPMGGRVDYHVEAVGPGGAVLARSGTPDAPLVQVVDPSLTPEESISLAAPAVKPVEDVPLLTSRQWWWVGGGATVAITAAITTALLMGGSASDPDTIISMPRVDFEPGTGVAP